MNKIILIALLSSVAFPKTIMIEPIIWENPCKEYAEEPKFESIDHAIQWYFDKTNCELDEVASDFNDTIDTAIQNIPIFVNWLEEHKEEILEKNKKNKSDSEQISPYVIKLFETMFDSLVLPKSLVGNGLYGYEARVSQIFEYNINGLKWVLDDYSYGNLPSTVLGNYDRLTNAGVLNDGNELLNVLKILEGVELVENINLALLATGVVLVVFPEPATTAAGVALIAAHKYTSTVFLVPSLLYSMKLGPDKMKEVLISALSMYQNNISKGYWMSPYEKTFWIPGIKQRYPNLSAINFNKFIRDVNFYNHDRKPLKVLSVPSLERKTVRNETWFTEKIDLYKQLKIFDISNKEDFEETIEHLDKINSEDVILYYFQGNGPLWDFSFVLTEETISVDRQVRPSISEVSYNLRELTDKDIKIIDYEGKKSLKVKGTKLKITGDLEMITFLRNTILETMKYRKAE